MNTTSNAGADVTASAAPPERATPVTNSSVLGILFAFSFCHLLNDAIQALLPAIYPLLKESFRLNFTQIGLITFTFQMVGSVLQPVVGFYTDKHPQPYSLAIGMGVTLVGMVLLALAPGYGAVLVAAALIGTGSAVFHPESSRMARLASGGRAGFAQSLFQVGGNFGTALGPFLAASVIVPRGQRHILWFTSLAALGIVILARVGQWCSEHSLRTARSGKPQQETGASSERRQWEDTTTVCRRGRGKNAALWIREVSNGWSFPRPAIVGLGRSEDNGCQECGVLSGWNVGTEFSGLRRYYSYTSFQPFS